MGFSQICVYRHRPTFSSELDERVFLCPSLQDAEKVRQRRSGVAQTLQRTPKGTPRSFACCGLGGRSF
jgi:hypothetical protein